MQTCSTDQQKTTVNLVLVGLSRWASSCLQQNAPLGHSSLVPNCTSLGTSNKINKPWSMNHDKSYTLLFDSLCYFVWHSSLDWSKIPACFILLDIPVCYPYHPIDSIRNYLWVVFVNIQCCSLDSWYLRSVWRVVSCHSYLFMVHAIYARVTKICWQAPNFPSFGHLVFSFSALRTFVLPPRRAWKPMGGTTNISNVLYFEDLKSTSTYSTLYFLMLLNFTTGCLFLGQHTRISLPGQRTSFRTPPATRRHLSPERVSLKLLVSRESDGWWSLAPWNWIWCFHCIFNPLSILW